MPAAMTTTPTSSDAQCSSLESGAFTTTRSAEVVVEAARSMFAKLCETLGGISRPVMGLVAASLMAVEANGTEMVLPFSSPPKCFEIFSNSTSFWRLLTASTELSSSGV